MTKGSKKDVVADTTKWDELLTRLAKLDTMHVTVGVMSDQGGSEKVEGSDLTMVELFAIHEFGTRDGHVPERAPMRVAFEDGEAQLRSFIAKRAQDVVLGRETPRTAYEKLGLYTQSMIQRRITSGPFLLPELAESTKERKGSERPLVDTGQMVQSITYAVREGKGDAG